MAAIFQSLVVYAAVAGMLFYLGRVAGAREAQFAASDRRLPFWTWEIVLSLLIFSVVSGLRWNVGADYQHYLAEYIDAQVYGSTSREFELGFGLLTRLVAATQVHYSAYFAIVAFLQVHFAYRAFRHDRYLLPYVGATIIMGIHYLTWMNGMRQMLVATAFLWAIKYISSRRWVPYVITVLLASLVHKSALLLLLAYFIPVRDIFSNRLAVFATFVVLVVVGMNPAWIALSEEAISTVSPWIGYDNYARSIGAFLDESKAVGFGPRMLAIHLLFLVAVFYSRKLKERFASRRFVVYYNIYVIGSFLFALFSNSHHIFLRPVAYLTICSLPVVACLLAYLAGRGSDARLQFLLVFLLAVSYTPMSVVADYGRGGEDFSNYRTFLFQSE